MLTTKPRGVNDILPSDVWKWQRLESYLRALSQRFGFNEIRTPIFEHTELFQRGIGDTSDVVEKEMYTFIDRGERSLTLRPEGTAGVVRAFVENKLYAQALPSKLSYFGPMFRYDRPQAGRYRQFHQFGVEIIGADQSSVDSELIAMAYEIFAELGLEKVMVSLNSVGCPICRNTYRTLLQTYFAPSIDQLCSTCQGRYERNPMRILDCKSSSCQALAKKAPTMTRHLCKDCQTHFNEVQTHLQAMGIPYLIDETLVRGLDYYTRTAFEITTQKGKAQSALCGGGRYDHLIEIVGGPAMSGIGFALGVERLLLEMQEQGVIMAEPAGCEVFILAIGEKADVYASALSHRLRKSKLIVQRDYGGKSMKAQLKAADRLGAEYVIIIGDQEMKDETLLIRSMKEGSQETWNQIKIDDWIHLYTARKLEGEKE